MNTLFDHLDDMFSQMDALINYPLSGATQFKNRGLKPVISRPHNLLTKKDTNGKTIGYGLEVVYTPFKKADVDVRVLNGELTVSIGSENKVKDADLVYCGISHQSYEFKLPLAPEIDTAKITAKAEDGVLSIDLPVIPEVECDPAPLKIEVK